MIKSMFYKKGDVISFHYRSTDSKIVEKVNNAKISKVGEDYFEINEQGSKCDIIKDQIVEITDFINQGKTAFHYPYPIKEKLFSTS